MKMRPEDKPILATNSSQPFGNFPGLTLWLWLFSTLFAASLPTMLQAQYEPTLVPGRSWVISGFQFNFDFRFPDSLFINGTVVYEDQDYSVIGSSANIGYQDTVAFMREDLESGKIWMRQYSPYYGPLGIVSEEMLVADYSLEIGDTLNYTFFNYWGDFDYNVLYTVIDTGNVDGRRYIELNNMVDSVFSSHWQYGPQFGGYSFYAVNQLPLRFYEGVGPSHGLLFPLDRDEGYMADPYVHCAYQDGELYFDDPYIIGCMEGLVLTTELLQPFNIFQIYPNPATGHFTLRMPEGEGSVVVVEIFDLNGKVLRQWNVQSEYDGSYSVEGLAAGIYLVKARSSRWVNTQKLVVQ